MSTTERLVKKLYYSIGEVSELTAIEKYVLRYWETEFPELKPAKNRAGNRVYKLGDVKLIFLIKKLLYVDKYTIEGARQKLKQLKRLTPVDSELTLEEIMKSHRLREIRLELYDILGTLEGNVTDGGSQVERSEKSG